MELFFDGRKITAKNNQSLYDMAKELGFFSGNLKTDPIAAKIAGAIFDLNFIPLLETERPLVRKSLTKALNASNGKVKLIRYSDPIGQKIYTRTAQFVIFLAIHKLWPNAIAKMRCTVNTGVLINVENEKNFSVDKLRAKMQEIVDQKIILRRKRVLTQEAISRYENLGQTDKARLLKYRNFPTFDVYEYEDFADYYYGEMAPNTGYLKGWDLMQTNGGFIFIFPDVKNPNVPAKYNEMPNILNVYTEGKNWCELMECETVADLNELVDSGKIRELIRVNEALHEKRFSQVADMICERGAKAVMLAGPSSSGKTTSANRLAVQLRVHGKRPILMSLDDYYIDRDLIMPGPDGKVDLEHINTIDTKLFSEHLQMLLKGEEVEIPFFNFKKGRREWTGHKMQLHDNSVIIVEGLHAMNPVLLPENLNKNLVFKFYVSPLIPLNLDDHNRIATSYLRLLRRIVRDYSTRNSPVQRTLEMWDSVRRGEEKWIFPFQENADVIFNSSTLYELAVLKKYIFPLLNEIQPEEDCYGEVRALVKILNFIHEADVADEIPPTSLIREFIGGNTFYKE